VEQLFSVLTLFIENNKTTDSTANSRRSLVTNISGSSLKLKDVAFKIVSHAL
jgi:hypothetical protein